jgi:hypothetical protein
VEFGLTLIFKLQKMADLQTLALTDPLLFLGHPISRKLALQF